MLGTNCLESRAWDKLFGKRYFHRRAGGARGATSAGHAGGAWPEHSAQGTGRNCLKSGGWDKLFGKQCHKDVIGMS